MATMTTLMALPTMAPPSALLERTSFAGAAVQGLPGLKTSTIKSGSRLRIEAKTRKVIPKEPLGPSGDLKFKVDANGRLPKGKGVYQFTRKYGANVDGYSPIYDKEEWSKSGEVYAGGQIGLALWAGLLGALLIGGALLVYNTSALS